MDSLTVQGLGDKRRRRERSKLRKAVQQAAMQVRNGQKTNDAREAQLLQSNLRRLKKTAEKDKNRTKAVEVLEKLVLLKNGSSRKKKTSKEDDDEDFDFPAFGSSSKRTKATTDEGDDSDF